ncbi:MAG: macro domain-containing protein [Ignavibacteria bacterium]|nr:macro domain-containing protein [Ignavibacteria bacterium]
MANIIEIDGDIFESKMQTLVNTVNCYGVMSKGIALEFKKRFPDMFKVYVRQCKERQLRPGVLYIYKKNIPWILNFPTKNHWRYPSKLEYIESGLEKFSLTYKKKGIKSIAFPKLGTLNGGLEWADVKLLMYKYLSPLDSLTVEIYHYQPEKSRNDEPRNEGSIFNDNEIIKFGNS